MTMPLLQRLAQTFRPASIVVIEPDASHPLLDEARATGAHVMIGQPSSPRVLLPVIAGRRGCALRRLYALRGDVTDNEAVLDAAQTILRRYQPDPDRQPHLVARIDDPAARGSLARLAHRPVQPLVRGRPQRPRIDRLRPARPGLPSPGPAVAAVRGQHPGPGHPPRTGPAGLGTAARASPQAPDPAERRSGGLSRPATRRPLPLQHVLLLDRRAEDLRREYLATSPPSVVRALCEVRAEPVSWMDGLLAMLDAMPPAAAAETTVVVADALSERGMHEAGRVARLHPGIPVFVQTSEGAGTSGAIFDLLHPFQRALLVDGEVPEDTWTRVARHWHECYRLSHPPAPGNPGR